MRRVTVFVITKCIIWTYTANFHKNQLSSKALPPSTENSGSRSRYYYYNWSQTISPQSTSLVKHSERRIFMSVTADDTRGTPWPLKRTLERLRQRRNGDFPVTNVEPVAVIFLGGLLSRKHIRGCACPNFYCCCGPEGIEGVSQPCYSRSAFLCSDATQGVTVAFATHSSYSWGLNFARALTARDWFFGSYFIFICWTVIWHNDYYQYPRDYGQRKI